MFLWNVFQQFMDGLISDLDGVCAYYDDLIVRGRNVQDCVERVRKLLDRLRENHIHLNPSKCKFFQKKISYLGHDISAQGLHKSESKIKAILETKAPANVEETRQFLGLIMYYKKFIPDTSTLLHPLNRLLRSGVKFHWD